MSVRSPERTQHLATGAQQATMYPRFGGSSVPWMSMYNNKLTIALECMSQGCDALTTPIHLLQPPESSFAQELMMSRCSGTSRPQSRIVLTQLGPDCKSTMDHSLRITKFTPQSKRPLCVDDCAIIAYTSAPGRRSLGKNKVLIVSKWSAS